MALVLSIFPGLDVLGIGFESEGFCVVRGPDVLWGGDVRDFHPPAGIFDGVIGGDPCQSHSTLANLVRAKGLEPRFPDLTPEYQRVVEEARPRWFLRENVPGAPDVKPAGYDVRSFLLDHSTMDRGDGTGHEQMRRRRFWLGVREGPCPEIRAFIDFALFVLPDVTSAVCAGHDGRIASGSVVEAAERKRQATSVPVKLGGSGKLKATINGQGNRAPSERRQQDGSYGGSAPRYSLSEMLELQGLPPDLLEHSPFTMQGKRSLVGNAVALPTARALAKAIRKAMGCQMSSDAQLAAPSSRDPRSQAAQSVSPIDNGKSENIASSVASLASQGSLFSGADTASFASTEEQ